MKKIITYLTSLGKTKLIISSIITVLVAGGGLYIYQSTNSTSSSEEIVKVIPKKSAFVMSFSPSNFLKKMDIKDLMENKLMKKGTEQVKGMGIDILESLLDDPSIIGLDFSSEIFVFHSYENKEEHYVCVSSGMKSDTKFTEFIKDAFKITGLKIEIKEENGLSYFAEQNAGIVWDDNKFIIIAGTTDEDDLKKHMKKLMTLDKDEMLTSNESFNTFYEKRQDLSVWTSTELADQFEDEIKEAIDSEFGDIKNELGISTKEIIDMASGNTFTFHINFGNGEIITSSSFTPNSKLRKLNTEYNLFDVDFNKQLLKYIPGDNIAILSQKINVDAYYKLISKYLKADNISDFESEISEVIDFNMNDLLNTFAGSFIANISGFGEVNITNGVNDYVYDDYGDDDYGYDDYGYDDYGDEEYGDEEYGDEEYGDEEFELEETTMTLPLFSVLFDMKDNELMQNVIDLALIESTKITKLDGHYSLDVEGMDMFIDFDKTTFILTNDQESIDRFNDGGYSKSLSSSSNIVDNISYAYLTLDYDEYSDVLNESFGLSEARETKEIIDIWDNLFESVEFKQSIDESTGTFSAEFKMSFKEKDKNILQTIFDVVQDNARNIYDIIS